MKCAYHPEKDATVQCANCLRPICEECSVIIDGRPYCNPCVSAAISRPPPQPPPYYIPPPGAYAPSKPTDLTVAGGALLLVVGITRIVNRLVLPNLYGLPLWIRNVFLRAIPFMRSDNRCVLSICAPRWTI